MGVGEVPLQIITVSCNGVSDKCAFDCCGGGGGGGGREGFGNMFPLPVN